MYFSIIAVDGGLRVAMATRVTVRPDRSLSPLIPVVGLAMHGALVERVATLMFMINFSYFCGLPLSGLVTHYN